jgi:hypothetical protein
MAEAARDDNYAYDVCLSFAGENREYVEVAASELRKRGVRVFYDKYEKAELWGKDLYEHLDYVYHSAARYCVLFASADYAAKVWTSHERKSAQARALDENREYILPARFDHTEIPGLRKTVGYIDLAETSPSELADLVVEKLGPRQTGNFFPPEPDRLYDAMNVTDENDREAIHYLASRFFRVLQRMSPDERSVITTLFLYGCSVELPENVHMSLDLLRRELGLPLAQVTELLGSVHALGFTIQLQDPEPGDAHELRGEDKMVVATWSNLTDVFDGEPTNVAYYVINCATQNFCEEHGHDALRRLDFSQLASATTTADEH